MQKFAGYGLVLGVAMILGACGNDESAHDDASTPDGFAAGEGGAAVVADGASAMVDAGGSSDAQASNLADARADTAPATVSSALGKWVWKEERERASDGTYTVKRTITEADLEWKVGPSGWPGCPTGISCLHYGNSVFMANAAGRYHVMSRVTTGSDFQNFGSFTEANGLLTFTREQEYSCAHPLADITRYPKPGTLYARYKKEGDDLWLTPFAATDPGAAPAKYTVYRAIGDADIMRYDLKFCGIGRDGAIKCHCLCPSRNVLADYACTT